MSVADWLMRGDPAIRWQVMRDLLDADPDAIAEERARVACEGWGAHLLSLQRADGSWDGGAWFPAGPRDRDAGQPWTSTAHVLMLLTRLGADPDARHVRDAAERAFASVRWEDGDRPFLEGESEACSLSTAITIGAYFGHDMSGPVSRLVADRRDDGGWNCDPPWRSQRSSFHSTIGALEALESQRRTVGTLTPESTDALVSGREYLLTRGLMFRLTTGAVVDPAYQRFSFPTYWHYDVLRGLEHLRDSGASPDPRAGQAIDMVRARRSAVGTWPLENTHRGPVPVVMEDGDGRPSRWNTLRALRVLRWWEDV